MSAADARSGRDEDGADSARATPAAGTGRAWAQRYGRAVMNTFGAPQRVLVRGRGARVWDADGAQYTDLLAGIAVNCLGHAHPAVVEAVINGCKPTNNLLAISCHFVQSLCRLS